jgi:PKD repeat protein
MNKFFYCRRYLQLALSIILILPELADAQSFFAAGNGDLAAGFRKTGSFTGNYELVVNIGSVTNFLAVPAGNSISIGNYSSSQLSSAFSDYNNLQWSVSSMVVGGPGYKWSGFEHDTIWFTLPRVTANTQTAPLARGTYTAQGTVRSKIDSFFIGANALSSAQGTTNANNNTILVRELISSANNNDYAYFVADSPGSAIGDFQGTMPTTVENTTPASFTSAVVSDLYQAVPTTFVDPNTGTTSGNAYYVGYFTLNPNGTMTFTRASTGVAAPVARFGGTPTNGVAPLQVVFTNSSTGSFTNSAWSFGDGNVATNTSGANVTNTYAAAGSYTVSLIVNGAGGSSTNTQANYIVATNNTPPAPVAGFSGTPTNIFATQTVVFTDASTGSITNWVWSFGDGSSVTNNSNASVNHMYAVAGTNTVSLVVNGAGGSSTNTRAGYIAVISAKVVFGGGSSPTSFGSGKFGFNGTGGPVGMQYRVLTQTNLSQSLANWTPIYTNVFGANGSYGYTNSTLVGNQGYLIMVSP